MVNGVLGLSIWLVKAGEKKSASAPRASLAWKDGVKGKVGGKHPCPHHYTLHRLSPGALSYMSISEGASLDGLKWPGQQLC